MHAKPGTIVKKEIGKEEKELNFDVQKVTMFKAE
jgi:hypothetical protein